MNNQVMNSLELTEDGKVTLTIDEIRILYELLSHQYISYDNEQAIVLMRKIRNTLSELIYE